MSTVSLALGAAPAWRRRGGVALATVATLLLGACMPSTRYHEPTRLARSADVPGAEATAAALAGEWIGQYDAPLYGRRGGLRVSLHRVARPGPDGTVVSSVAGTATLLDAHAASGSVQGSAARPAIAVDSARVGTGRVALWFEPFADADCGCTIQLRLDGALAADTLGGRLRGDVAATVASERRGGWRVVRVVPTIARTTR